MNEIQPQELTEKLVNLTNQCVFLTGKAGTGKTTFLKNLIDSTHKQAVIVAPTGIAALNAGGVTIHSFFQLPFSGFIPDFVSELQVSNTTRLESKSTLLRHFRFNTRRQQLFRSIELLIIDEVSMLRADLLDAMDWVLRNIRKVNEPFGGVQVLFIGDLHQLPPVIKQQEWSFLSRYYSGIHFFNAKVLQERPPVYVELTKIYRQQDQSFIEVLNQLRTNQLTHEGLNLINQKVNTHFESTNEKGYITLTTHNHKADVINQKALNKLKTKEFNFQAEITGDFPPHIYPLDVELKLKVGSQVMFIKNDLSFEKLYYNGKMAIVVALDKYEIVVECIEDGKRIVVQKFEWENIRYTSNASSGEVEEEVIGTFVHYPIKLAWAITVHKSQGLTFDKAVLDVSDVFAPGQAYVALSRLRSLNGLVMLKPMKINGINSDEAVIRFSETKKDVEELSETLPKYIKLELYARLMKTYDWLEMATKWASQENSCKDQSTKTVKGEIYSWISIQNHEIQSTLEPARKFRNQLMNLFHSPNYQPEKLMERVNASVSYFFPILDAVYSSLVKKMMELNRVKKSKAVVEELLELEELLLDTILNLKKTQIIVQHIVDERKIDKRTSFSSEVSNYKTERLAKAQQSLVSNADLFVRTNQEDDTLFFTKNKKGKNKTKAEKKKPTIEQTFELLENGMTIDQIAKKRQLTVNTIYGHLAQLIQNQKIDIHQVVEGDTLEFLKRTLPEKKGSLSEMKDLVGDQISYEVLRLYQAHLS